ncbi:hypothetical protein [Streptomyces sp. NBC_00572]|uniref:hypothetical protein n=1 Tax=Streptomyces sp. NBC_00572 TaxID=2903664 RepID=UPI00224DB0CE|nr:hypothetical protein [Streptomyces sp. NBC_00572]MCX4985992.1 hypothetical protein [Streptomyces sp. NBC_00572]
MTHPQWVSPRQAVRRRVMFEGRVSRVVDYFGGAASASGPQAYLVEQRDYVLRPHFHPVDQFQILCGARGSLFGRRPVGELDVHYADAHTVYGPLTGGDPPLRYFTLRAEPTDATAFMPESRALLPPRRTGRSLHVDASARAAIGPESGDRAAPVTDGGVTLLDDSRDGLRVSRLTCGPGAALPLPEAGEGGQFLYVAAGTVVSADASYGPETLGWQPPRTLGAAVQAGPDGATILVLRHPAPADRAARTTTDQRRPPHPKGDTRAR